ncbi:MAG: Kae1-associated kinase Bud32 [Hadesarchaea archaeon]|nr:MAG: Kae1-associated kinase Bud32 [Hadesarchaea archaeon]HDI13052.1 Kae1-associated serine/threonine protein kinase [Hadesarchaea archaeon]
MLIKKGAEADIYLEPFRNVLHGAGQGKVMVKQRISKRYRIPEMDRQLRVSRTMLEAKLFSDAKRAGVPTPLVYEVDREDTRIVMEFIRGRQVKLILDSLNPGLRRKLCRLIGRYVARLHRAGIVHGDLTTSNMIFTDEGRIYFVDFGLGGYDSSIEARGVDLHLLRRALQSIHFRITDDAYRAVLSGYRREFGKGAGEVIKRAEEIGRRGRYIQKEARACR